MPRKQRFKPSRKPKPMPMAEATHGPMTGRTSSARNASGLEPGLRETERREVHPDDVESEGLDG